MPDHSPSVTDEIPTSAFRFHSLADGAQIRYAIFDPPGPPRGTILIAQGRREFVEKKYYELGPGLLARGLRVIGFDWRGQGLSTRFFDGARRQRDHAHDMDIYTADLRSFYDGVVKQNQTGPLLIFAHSMGALLILRWLAEGQKAGATPEVKAVLMSAPALALGLPHFVEAIARMAERLGFGESYAALQYDYGKHDRGFDGNVLTHDPVRFALIDKYFTGNPQLTVGGVTWGWLHAALRAMDDIQRPGYLEAITQPMLAVLAGDDKVTPTTKTRPLLQRLPHAEIVTIPHALHDLMNEADLYRLEAWRHIDGFLERVMPKEK